MKPTENIEEKKNRDEERFKKGVERVKRGDERYRGFARNSDNSWTYVDGKMRIPDMKAETWIWDKNGVISHCKSGGDASDEGEFVGIIKENRKLMIMNSKKEIITFGGKHSENEKQVFAVIYLCSNNIATLIVADSKLPKISVVDYFMPMGTDNVDEERSCDPVLTVLHDLFVRNKSEDGEGVSNYAQESGSESSEDLE